MPRLSESQNPKVCEGSLLMSVPPSDQWVGGYQRRMPQNFRHLVMGLGVRICAEPSNPPPLEVAVSPAKTNGFQGVIQKADRKKRHSSTLTLIIDNDGGVGLHKKPDNLNLGGLPPFIATLANTAAIITTNCVKLQKDFSYFPKGSSAYFTLSIKANDNTFTSRGSIKLRIDQPWLWIMGDHSIPEILEGPGGKVVGIIRVEDASFETLRRLLRATLPPIKP